MRWLVRKDHGRWKVARTGEWWHDDFDTHIEAIRYAHFYAAIDWYAEKCGL